MSGFLPEKCKEFVLQFTGNCAIINDNESHFQTDGAAYSPFREVKVCKGDIPDSGS